MGSNQGAIPNERRVVWSMDVYPELLKACEPPLRGRDLAPRSWAEILRRCRIHRDTSRTLARFSNNAAERDLYKVQHLVVGLPINNVDWPPRGIPVLSCAGSSKLNDPDVIIRRTSVTLSLLRKAMSWAVVAMVLRRSEPPTGRAPQGGTQAASMLSPIYNCHRGFAWLSNFDTPDCTTSAFIPRITCTSNGL